MQDISSIVQLTPWHEPRDQIRTQEHLQWRDREQNTHAARRAAELSQNNIKINVISDTSSVAGNI